MRKFYKTSVGIIQLLLFTIVSVAQETGIIQAERSANYGVVSFTQAGALSGISDAKHVDGYVRHYGSGAFTFPVGNKGSYRPFASNADGITGAYFQQDPNSAQLPENGPFSTQNKDAAVLVVSDKEYWDINGTNPASMTLTWNAASDISALVGSDLSFLSIVGWNTSTGKWEKVASVIDGVSIFGTPSSLSTGSVTCLTPVVPGTYEVYTLGRLNSAQTTPDYEGVMEIASCSEVIGWAWNKSYPNTAVIVELIEGNTVHASITADAYRSDIKDAGKGTGKYGFKIPLPTNLKDGNVHQLSVRVRNSSYVLGGSPKATTCSFQGNFEVANCDVIKGWVWNSDFPDAAQTIELVEGTTVHATITADNFRQDLQNNGLGTGKYGFSIVPPLSLKDGKAHSLSVRIKDSKYVLSGSAKSIFCSAPNFGGTFEIADCNQIKGWVLDKNYPNVALTIELIEGSTVHASVLANVYREDVKNAGFGTGYYGFNFQLPASLKDGQAHQLSVRVKDTNFILTNSPRNISCTSQPVPFYAGSFQSADCNQIIGWIWDKNNANTAQVIELIEGNTVHATVTANIYRSDLKNAGYGTGNYGFSFALPASLKDGLPHQLSVKVKNANYTLSGSPKSITCTSAVVPLYVGSFQTADCNQIIGWVWDKNSPNTAQVIELIEGNTVHATVTANIYRSDLKNAGYGSGNYGFNFALPASLKDGLSHQLSVRVKNANYTLSGSPKNITCTSTVIPLYVGSFQTADCNQIIGWVWDKNEAGAAQVIELIEGSTVHATVTANIYRSDLKNAGYGTGNYGFNFALPASLKDGQSHQLSVRVKNSNYTLSGSPKTVNCTSAITPLYAGSFQTADCNVIRGWIWDKNSPNTAVTIELIEGATVHATALANIYRSDVKNAGFGTGNYGFSFELPASLKDGQPHQISIRVKGGSYILTNSPKSITCASAVVPLYVGNFQTADCNQIVGWVWDKNGPDKALTVELFEGNVIHATVMSNIYRSDLKTAGIGTGNYGFNFPLPATLKDGQAHQLGVRVKDGNYTLSGSPKSINCGVAIVPLYAGSFQGADCNVVKGWVWDKNNPETAQVVELVEGSTVFATVTASSYRSDVKNAGFGTGYYGFSFALPAALKDGQPHQLIVRVKNSTYKLSGSPRSITCAPSARMSAAPADVIRLKELEEFSLSLDVWPNPTHGIELHIRSQATSRQKATISLINLVGHKVWFKSFNSPDFILEHKIDLSQYAEGVYLLKVERGDKIEAKRVIISR
ncbi:T9SS type A sorting domain-containing protein [Dyadobacter sp. CY107]|uniref:T9SS type A sorting domain-containing protein n=1 Tax=Dyadobacter fanqingshengii TaxID=2906443 RepID=UPI001F2C3B22|nr:T9SS type A sorting domain-containing protein [Dyadobacter fanqingshengii]MCF2504696.1 T9SS type A sorting domain-containing protein [Dyadobacter fanqingshengii]